MQVLESAAAFHLRGLCPAAFAALFEFACWTLMELLSPAILWHGGVSENGKPAPAPVFSVDMIQSNCLVTAGVNESTPPMGCVRFWSMYSIKVAGNGRAGDSPEYIIELADHISAVNAAKFSPCGLMLATASDRQIVVYKAKSKDTWSRLTSAKSLEKLWLSPSLTEIYDVQWSPDSSHIVAGAIDNKAEVIRLSSKLATTLSGHSSYVQGVAWDPLNKMVVTQSADRSCRVHTVRDSCLFVVIDTIFFLYY